MVKINIKKTVLILASLLSMKAAADATDLQNQKSSQKIDFNKMIEEGNEKKQELTWKEATIQRPESPSISDSERKAVIDFIDVEVGVGKTPSVVGVDRRYNSVGEATVVDIDSLGTLDVKLMKKAGI